jgi:hypothetical protein
MDRERLAQAWLWLRIKHPDAGLTQADAIEFLERLDSSHPQKGAVRKQAALDIARRMATTKRSHALMARPVRRTLQGRNLPTVSDKVPKVQPIPKRPSMAQNPNEGKPAWHSTSPGGSIDGKGPARTPVMKGAYGRSRYGRGR